MNKVTQVLVMLVMVWILFMPEGHAYIDPGTGSMLLQALAAGFVAILVFGKRIYVGVMAFFNKNQAGETEEQPSGEDTDA